MGRFERTYAVIAFDKAVDIAFDSIKEFLAGRNVVHGESLFHIFVLIVTSEFWILSYRVFTTTTV